MRGSRVRGFISFHFLQSRKFHNDRRSVFHIRRIFHFTFPLFNSIISSRKGGVFMAKSKLREMSIDFAVSVINICETVKGHHSLVNQLERSATSIGANIHEANYAHSKADFIAKLQIALKECYETEYWLELFVKSEILNREVSAELSSQCGTIRRILIASINTAKGNAK